MFGVQMSYEGVLGIFEDNSGEIKNVISDVIVENNEFVNSSYIIMGHSSEELINESVNLCYKQIGENGEAGEEQSIIFNDIKNVEEDWWNNFSDSGIVSNSVNESITLPSIPDLSNGVVEEGSVSNVNWEDYVLDSESYNNATSSILSNSFFLVPTNSEQSCENDLEVHQVDGYFNSPNVVVSNSPTNVKIASPISVCDVSKDRSSPKKEVSLNSQEVISLNGVKNISQLNFQDTFKKLPFVKVPKDCLARGKILGKKAISLLSRGNTIYSNVNSPARPITNFGTNSLKQLSHYNNKIQSPLDLQTTLNANSNQTVVIFPVQQKKKTQIALDSLGLSKGKHPRSLLKINNTPSAIGQTQSQKDNHLSGRLSSSENRVRKSPVAVVAISTDKGSDTTEIVIKTEEGENVFKGKTSDIMKATRASKNVKNSGLDCTNLQQSHDGETVKDLMVKLLGVTDEVLDSIDSTSSVQLQCPVDSCVYNTSKGSRLKVHILQHYGIRPFKCEYPSCTWAFYTKFRLKRHQECHFKKKEYKCSIEGCGRCFSTPYNLKHHVKLHNRPNNLVCTVENCQQAFATRRSYEKHLKDHGEEYAPYTCQEKGCGRKYFTVSTLNAHSRLHQHADEETRCSYCGKKFPHPCRLKEHINIHIGVRPFKCDFQDCIWSFSTSSKLRRHQRKHTQIRKYYCKICKKGFLRLEHLKDHNSKHYAKKPFACTVAGCESVFFNKSSLYAHLKKHRIQATKNDQDTFVCPMENCYLVFTTAEDLRLHLQTGHGPSAGCVSFNTTSQEGLLVGMSDLVQCIPTSDHGELLESNTTNIVTQVVFTDDQPADQETAVSDQTTLLTEIDVEEGIGSARTGLTYQAVVGSKGQVTVDNPGGLHMASDVVLSAGLVTTQDALDRNLLLQDEITGVDLYMGAGQEEAGLLGSAGELQVLLLDPSTRLQHSDFEQSTINLRDLE